MFLLFFDTDPQENARALLYHIIIFQPDTVQCIITTVDRVKAGGKKKKESFSGATVNKCNPVIFGMDCSALARVSYFR